jgi:hypothetical protein
VLRAPPVAAFYDYVKSAGGGTVEQRPFSASKRSLLLYDDDTHLDHELVPLCHHAFFCPCSTGLHDARMQLKSALASVHADVGDLVAMKLQGLTREQMMQVII